MNKNFVRIGLMKFFVMNVNFSLILPCIAVIVYFGYLMRKYKIRSKYIKNRIQSDNDVYTVIKRSGQWIYDHCVFPLINVLNIISFSCTILYLRSI
jgi:hypothetical protein